MARVRVRGFGAPVDESGVALEYVLEMTKDEAETLRVVLANVDGSPDNSPRKNAQAIANELSANDIDYRSADAYKYLSGGGSIYFRDYPKTFEPGYYRNGSEGERVRWFATEGALKGANLGWSGENWTPVTVAARDE